MARSLVHRGREVGRRADLADADARAEVRGLHEAGETRRRGDSRRHRGRPDPPLAAEHDRVLDDGQTVRAEEAFHRRLVHPDGGGRHAGADVGEVREFEHTLDRPVFAVRAVEHDEHDVELAAEAGGKAAGLGQVGERGAGDGRRAGALDQRLLDGTGRVGRGQGHARLRGERAERVAPGEPAAVARDADGDDLVAGLRERPHHRRGRRQRHLVLARPAAEDHPDAEGHPPLFYRARAARQRRQSARRRPMSASAPRSLGR